MFSLKELEEAFDAVKALRGCTRLMASPGAADLIRTAYIAESRLPANSDHPLYWRGYPVIVIDKPGIFISFMAVYKGSPDAP